MKEIEIIIPNGRLTDVDSVLNSLNVGGMSHYGIEGTGKISIPHKPSQNISRDKKR
jgi:nitrogen regulatory protein PII